MSARARHQACLVLNAGSSSLKFSVFRQPTDGGELLPIVSGQIAGIGAAATFEARDAQRRVLAEHAFDATTSRSREALLAHVLQWIATTQADDEIVAAGHRVVHGGRALQRPARIDAALIEQLDALVSLAPLHQPHNLAPIRILARNHPGLAQVACFDTAFHSTLPWEARTFALPRELSDSGISRYGFHGLSYEYVSQRLIARQPELAAGRMVICHLGNGSSACAVHGGCSVDSTMGFTALDGLPMGTRSGALDPGVILHLMRERGMDLDAVEDLLYRRSGLLGVSGLSNDMKVLQSSDDPAARQAVALYCFRIAKEVASLATSMGGLDALVFTAGIGEHSALVREQVVGRLAWLGARLDTEANQRHAHRISAADGRLPVYVVPTNEELMIARHTMDVLAGSVSPAPAAARTAAPSDVECRAPTESAA
ncbi:acetate/propionate family kinase [Ideonella sp. A 288]|uniref:acetate/propionate family kinase n=1 Tax=Ideonella sp. A 288 TaxID=1962181 RepID=UPI000B4B723C|nr:acetate/propionate family kinase [Ideonella sp. A 288]